MVQTPYAASNVRADGNGHMGNGMPIDTITMSTFSGGHRRAITGMTPEIIVTYNLSPNPTCRAGYVLRRSQQSGLLTTSGRARKSTVLADNIWSLHYALLRRPAMGRELGLVQPAAREPVAGRGGDPDSRWSRRAASVMDFATQVTLPMAIAAMVKRLAKSERGVALLAVLLGIALMTLIVVDFAMTSGLGFVVGGQPGQRTARLLPRAIGSRVGLGTAGGGRAHRCGDARNSDRHAERCVGGAVSADGARRAGRSRCRSWTKLARSI